jgi:glycosyltransferase involved in cell wall biosynthesis
MTWARKFRSELRGVTRSISGFHSAGWTPDVILAHSTAWAGVLATRAGEAFGLPVVIVEHSCPWLLDQYTPPQRAMIRTALAKAITVCAVSPALRRLMLAHELPESIHWEVVGNLVDEGVFFPASEDRASEGVGEYRILTVAARTAKKDVGTLFKAVARARAQRPDLRLAVRAVGDERGVGPSFTQLAADNGIGDIVAVDAGLSRAETAVAMRESDLFVSPSIAETFGIVMAEALACGIPVVATRSGGAEYILGEGSPFLVEPREPEALAAKMLDVIDGAQPFDSRVASCHVIDRFGTRAFGARMTGVLDEARARWLSSEMRVPSNPAGIDR